MDDKKQGEMQGLESRERRRVERRDTVGDVYRYRDNLCMSHRRPSVKGELRGNVTLVAR